MLQLFFTVAFSAVPLTLYVPPVRSLNLFVETMEDLLRESRLYTNRLSPRARLVWSRILDIMLCNLRPQNVVPSVNTQQDLCGIHPEFNEHPYAFESSVTLRPQNVVPSVITKQDLCGIYTEFNDDPYAKTQPNFTLTKKSNKTKKKRKKKS